MPSTLNRRIIKHSLLVLYWFMFVSSPQLMLGNFFTTSTHAWIQYCNFWENENWPVWAPVLKTVRKTWSVLMFYGENVSWEYFKTRCNLDGSSRPNSYPTPCLGGLGQTFHNSLSWARFSQPSLIWVGVKSIFEQLEPNTNLI